MVGNIVEGFYLYIKYGMIVCLKKCIFDMMMYFVSCFVGKSYC